jgi:hypothetical protein
LPALVVVETLQLAVNALSGMSAPSPSVESSLEDDLLHAKQRLTANASNATFFMWAPTARSTGYAAELRSEIAVIGL